MASQLSLQSEQHPERDQAACAGEKRWFILSVALALFCGLVLSMTQSGVLWHENISHPIKDSSFRFLLNFTLFATIVLAFRRFLLTAAILLSLLLQFSLLFYALQFRAPPTYANFFMNTREGVAVTESILGLFPWGWFGLYCGLGAVACLFVCLRDWPSVLRLQYSRYSGRKRLKHTLSFALAFVSLFGVLNISQRSLHGKNLHYSTSDIVAKFGITPVFIRDAIRVHNLQSSGLFAAAVEKEKERSFLLDEENLPTNHPKHIVVIQAEALDYAALNFAKNGKPITPFLNRLLDTSLHYRIQASTGYGSATADFVMLTGIPPAQGIFNYHIAGFPYNTSLPAFLREQGYHTYAVHGARVEYYNRIQAYTDMKFDTLAFKQEILDELDLPDSTFRAKFSEKEIDRFLDHDWLPDDLLCAYTQWVMENNAEKKKFFLILTTSSHPAFTAPVPETIVPNASKIQDLFMNTIHFMDAEIGKLYESLPDGTLFVVYGDHGARLDTVDFRSDRTGSAQFVPLIFSVKGENIAAKQAIAANASDRKLSLRDAHSFIRKTVDAKTMPTEIMASEKPGTIR